MAKRAARSGPTHALPKHGSLDLARRAMPHRADHFFGPCQPEKHDTANMPGQSEVHREGEGGVA